MEKGIIIYLISINNFIAAQNYIQLGIKDFAPDQSSISFGLQFSNKIYLMPSIGYSWYRYDYDYGYNKQQFSLSYKRIYFLPSIHLRHFLSINIKNNSNKTFSIDKCFEFDKKNIKTQTEIKSKGFYLELSTSLDRYLLLNGVSVSQGAFDTAGIYVKNTFVSSLIGIWVTPRIITGLHIGKRFNITKMLYIESDIALTLNSYLNHLSRNVQFSEQFDIIDNGLIKQQVLDLLNSNAGPLYWNTSHYLGAMFTIALGYSFK